MQTGRIEILTYGHIHVHHIDRRNIHHQVRVDLIGRNAVTDIIRADERIAHAAQHTFEREGIAGRLFVRADSVVRHDDVAVELAVGRHEHLAREGDRRAVGSHGFVDTADLHHRTAVDPIEDRLDHSCTRHSRCAAAVRLRFIVLPLAEQRAVRHIAVGRYAGTEIGHTSGCDAEHGAVEGRHQIVKVRHIVVTPRAGTEQACQDQTEHTIIESLYSHRSQNLEGYTYRYGEQAAT